MSQARAHEGLVRPGAHNYRGPIVPAPPLLRGIQGIANVAGLVWSQHPLDRVPLVPGGPAVGPRDRLRGAPHALSGHDVLRSPGACRSGPQGIEFPH